MITIKDEKLNNINNLNVFLEEDISNKEVDETSCFAYWSTTPSKDNSRPTLRLVESPFFGYGTEATPFGLIYSYEDNFYYNTLSGNSVQDLLSSEWIPEERDFEQARQALEIISKYCISKYNHYPMFSMDSYEHEIGERAILLIDQPIDADNVLSCGANQENFAQMFLHAFENFTDYKIFIKYHPQTINGFQEGYLQRFLKKNKLTDHPAVRIIDKHSNMVSILNCFEEVFTVTSTAGFEAAIRGKNVTTFGNSFYSGYGFTNDTYSQNKKNRNPIDIFIAIYIKQGIYINPFTQQKGTILDVLDYISLQLRHRNTKDVIFYKSEMAKSSGISSLLNLKNEKHVSSSNKANFVFEKNALIVADNSVSLGQIPKGTQKAFINNGFLFSGDRSNNQCPISIIFDTKAAYYQENNELEDMLNSEQFTNYELEQSNLLIEKIKEKFKRDLDTHPSNNLNKYYLENKKIILIPGVSDENLYNYEPLIRSDYDLICEVNKRNNNTVIIYKPTKQIKSDLIKKIKKQLKTENGNTIFVDIENHISQCLNICQEVHLVNNIYALEALINNKTVVTYGQSFYSHRGLTVDLFNNESQKQHIGLKELIAGSLMLYPRYKISNCDYFVNATSAMDSYINNYINNIKPANQNFFKKIIYAILND